MGGESDFFAPFNVFGKFVSPQLFVVFCGYVIAVLSRQFNLYIDFPKRTHDSRKHKLLEKFLPSPEHGAKRVG